MDIDKSTTGSPVFRRKALFPSLTAQIPRYHGWMDCDVVAGEQERAGASELAGALAGRLVGGFLCCHMAGCVPGKSRSGLLSSGLCQELPEAAPQGFIGTIGNIVR